LAHVIDRLTHIDGGRFAATDQQILILAGRCSEMFYFQIAFVFCHQVISLREFIFIGIASAQIDP
jgi:hypothetical protein